MEPSGAIPKIIHQTWKNEEIPTEWVGYVQSWKDMHPEWHHRLWTDEANRAFVQEHYPSLLRTYDAYPYAIQRADAIRYCLLHHFGGVYVDMDIECLRPLDDLIADQDFVAVQEPEEQAGRLERQVVVSNALLASRSGHPFLEAILKALKENPRAGVTHRDVLEITGPIMMSHVFEQYRGGAVSLLKSRVAFPFAAGSPELERMREKADGFESLKLRAIDEGAYCLHYWANTWIGTLAGDLVNREPDAIDGFDFVRGFDSPGNDIVNLGRDICRAAEACLEISDAIAFNTDGFAKSQLLPRELWQPMGNGAFNEGLYVRKPPRSFGSFLTRWLRRR